MSLQTLQNLKCTNFFKFLPNFVYLDLRNIQTLDHSTCNHLFICFSYHIISPIWVGALSTILRFLQPSTVFECKFLESKDWLFISVIPHDPCHNASHILSKYLLI